MTLEQLEALKGIFEQLEGLKYQLKRFENDAKISNEVYKQFLSKL